MEKTYNYSLQDLKDLLNLLLPYQHTSQEIDKDIENLTYFINYLYPQENQEKRSFTHISTLIRKQIKEYTFLKPFEYFIKEFAWKGESPNLLSIRPYHKNILIPDAIAVTDALSFLSNHGPFFKEPLEEFESDITTHLKFINEDLDISGGTLYLQSTGEAYVYAPDQSNITKPSILTHELEHVIDFFNNPNMYNSLVTREVIPVFMELVSLEQFGNKYNVQEEAYQRMLHLYAILKQDALNFIEKLEILDIAARHPKLSDDNLLKLLQESGYSLEFLAFLVQLPIQDFYYQIPELIAIELYFLYQDNKEKVISILQEIALHGNDTNLLELIANHKIKLTKNIEEFEYHLLSKAKR